MLFVQGNLFTTTTTHKGDIGFIWPGARWSFLLYYANCPLLLKAEICTRITDGGMWVYVCERERVKWPLSSQRVIDTDVRCMFPKRDFPTIVIVPSLPYCLFFLSKYQVWNSFSFLFLSMLLPHQYPFHKVLRLCISPLSKAYLLTLWIGHLSTHRTKSYKDIWIPSNTFGYHSHILIVQKLTFRQIIKPVRNKAGTSGKVLT